MTLNKIIFSPTGGTRKAADLLARSLSTVSSEIDLCDPSLNFSACFIQPEDVSLFAVPSFAGRVPKIAIDRIRQLDGNGSRAVLMVVYGNREYEDTLIELYDACIFAGFCPIAAVTAIAEHSMARHIAAHRPNEQDAAQLESFAEIISQRLESDDCAPLTVPGNRPYKQVGKNSLVPLVSDACTQCGTCAELCPVHAIDPQHPDTTDTDACITCMRCISVCPVQARELNPVGLAALTQRLNALCAVPKSNRLF